MWHVNECAEVSLKGMPLRSSTRLISAAISCGGLEEVWATLKEPFTRGMLAVVVAPLISEPFAGGF